MGLEYALKDGPQPERSYCYPAPCPRHGIDEARLDYLPKGWHSSCQVHLKRGRCAPVWRNSILCDAMFQEYFCEKTLPAVLRQVRPK